MRNMFENAKIFEAYAAIDFFRYQLEVLIKKNDKQDSPIVRMVDQACGFNRSSDKNYLKDGLYIFKQLVKYKKIIEAPYDREEEIIAIIKKYLKK